MTTQQELQLTLFSDTASSRHKYILDVPVVSLVLSRFNPRRTRQTADVEKLAQRMQRNGYEITRAMWVYPAGDVYEVFAGGTRYEAAKLAGLTTVPVVVHEGFSDDEIAGLADVDNENDEYHSRVPIVDVWAEYWRLNKEEGWTQERIAKAKGENIETVRVRVKLHTALPDQVKKATQDGILDEGHCVAISSVTQDVLGLHPWLTTEQAQIELTNDLLRKYTSPTVKAAREMAATYKDMIAAAQQQYQNYEEPWASRFVELLAERKARTKAAIYQCAGQVTKEQTKEAERVEAELAAQRDAAEVERLRLEREQREQARVAAILERIHHGDARAWIETLEPFHVLLTDPPYGMQSWPVPNGDGTQGKAYNIDDFSSTLVVASFPATYWRNKELRCMPWGSLRQYQQQIDGLLAQNAALEKRAQEAEFVAIHTGAAVLTVQDDEIPF